jgi:hypothetical protein
MMIILNGSQRNRMGGYGLDSSGSEEEQVVGSCEQGNKFSGTLKCNKFD